LPDGSDALHGQKEVSMLRIRFRHKEKRPMNTPYVRTIDEERAHGDRNEQKIQQIREWANQLQGGGNHHLPLHPVWIKMPNSAQPILIGGEILLQALAAGGQPVNGQQFKATINGEPEPHRPIQFL
jgi:hypothetical protein